MTELLKSFVWTAVTISAILCACCFLADYKPNETASSPKDYWFWWNCRSCGSINWNVSKVVFGNCAKCGKSNVFVECHHVSEIKL